MERRLLAVQALQTGHETQEHDPWIKDVVQGVLRLRGRLDYIIDQYATVKKPTGLLRKVLEIALYQFLEHETVTHSKVTHETVELVKVKVGEKPSGFANAILRSMLRDLERWRVWECPADLNAQASWASLEPWFWQSLVADHGFEVAKKIAVYSLERPKIYVRNREQSYLELPEGARSRIGAWLLETGSIVQDLSSQKMVDGLDDYLKKSGFDPSKTKVLDLCAAPGGKSIALAWKGYQVSAYDQSASRIKMLNENIRRLNANVKVVTEQELPECAPDVLWVDAPCSSSGLIRRHPDIRWRKTKDDISKLVQVQRELISKAVAISSKSSAVLVYSVCSFFRSESEDQAKWIEANSNYRIRQSLRFGMEGQEDGFFGALLDLPVRDS